MHTTETAEQQIRNTITNTNSQSEEKVKNWFYKHVHVPSKY